ncbi:hypothetical protein B0H14DRAFT_3152474 [Mycena olivaceomarginata]|nr:hypothetical protein B0H14DRAFT_3152474 [Mycena olivaceomarginata]
MSYPRHLPLCRLHQRFYVEPSQNPGSANSAPYRPVRSASPPGIRCTAHVQILPADDPPLPPSPSPSASTDPAASPPPPLSSPAPPAGIPPALLQVALRAAADEEQRLALQAALEASLPAALQVALQAALPPLLTKLEGKIDDWRRFERKNYNRALGDDSAVPLEPVPFPDGTLPSANPSTAELVEYCSRYCPDRVYTGVSGGLGADGEDERGRERERAQRIRDVRVAVGWVGGGDGDGGGDCTGDGGGDGGEEDKGASASGNGNGNGNGQAADEKDPETDVPYSDPAYAALGL